MLSLRGPWILCHGEGMMNMKTWKRVYARHPINVVSKVSLSVTMHFSHPIRLAEGYISESRILLEVDCAN